MITVNSRDSVLNVNLSTEKQGCYKFDVDFRDIDSTSTKRNMHSNSLHSRNKTTQRKKSVLEVNVLLKSTIYFECFGLIFIEADCNRQQFRLCIISIIFLLGLRQKYPFAIREISVAEKRDTLLWQYNYVTFCVLQKPFRELGCNNM